MTKYIIISGVDGSGKTTIIEGVKAALEADGKIIGYIWMRYHHKLTTVMHAIAKLTGLSRKEKAASGTVGWSHYFYRSRLFCWFYLRFALVDAWIARKKPIKLAESITNGYDYVICDRWVNDIIIDMGGETHNPNILDSVWYSRFQSVLPENCFQFVVLRDRKETIECREENRNSHIFEYRYQLYGKLASKEGIIKIDNNGSIEHSVNQVLEAIR